MPLQFKNPDNLPPQLGALQALIEQEYGRYVKSREERTGFLALSADQQMKGIVRAYNVVASLLGHDVIDADDIFKIAADEIEVRA